jgi:hypothetical protein
MFNKISYNIELISILLIVLLAGSIYGVIEALYIPTDSMELPIFGRFSYYHVGLLSLMAVCSFSLALSHIQWILTNRKTYIILMCLAALPLSLMIEDTTWFITKWQPIGHDDWTMISPGLGFNIGFTWVPLWYILSIIVSIILFWYANKCAEKGYKIYLYKNYKIPNII